MWNLIIVLFALGALASIPKQFRKKIKYAGITERKEYLQKIVSLGSARTLRKVLEILDYCL